MSEAQRQRDEDARLIDAAQASVGATLLDPTSPIFSETTVKGATVCGYVNAKNTFGGYVGRKRFTFVEGTQATLEPDPNEFTLLRKEVREGPSCMFDISFRTCKGETGLPSVTSCLAYLDDDVEAPPGTPAMTKTAAEAACLKALNDKFNSDIRPGALTARSSQASVNTMGTWQVRIEWTAYGADFSGMESAGTCAVNSLGVARVSALNSE